MIFELFISFTILSCVLIFLGYYVTPSIKVLAVLGFATLFFLGLLLQFNGVSVRTGQTDAYTYMCQACVGNSIPALAGNDSTSDLSSTITSFNYDVIDDSTSVWIGRWLSIVSALGVALVFSSNKEKDD